MPIRTLYNQQDMPLMLAVDMYNQVFRPSIDNLSVFDNLQYQEPTNEMVVDWSLVSNNLLFTKGYVSLFSEPVMAVWVAYECLSTAFKNDTRADDLHIFFYNGEKFYLKEEGNNAAFLLPEEY